MDTYKNNVTLSEDRQNELATNHSRQMEGTQDGKNGNLLELVTVGFTIQNCTQLIGESLGDPGVLGWFIHLADGDSQYDKISSITLSELRLVPKLDDPGKLLLKAIPLETANGDTPDIRPKVVFQIRDPQPDPILRTDTGVDYNDAVILTKPEFFNDPNLLISDFSHHTDWARAVFFRRSDLRYLRILLLQDPLQYNDIFFSGGKANYDTMHNPPLRVMQLTLPGTQDSSLAFTLKAEPFVNSTLKNNGKNEVSNPDLTLEVKLTGEKSVSTRSAGVRSAGAHFPAVAFGIQCPDYWGIITEIDAIMNASSAPALATLAAFSEDLENIMNNASIGNTDTSTNSLTISKFPDADLEGIVNATSPVPPITPGSDNWLYKLLTGIINSVTNLRAWIFS